MEGAIRRVIVPLSVAVVAGLVAALVLLGGRDSGAPAGPERGTFVIGQFNMAGGTTEHGGKGNPAPDALAADVKDRKADFLTMQETCRDWGERLEDRLPGYTVLFSPVDNLARNPGTPARCHHPTDFGNTIVYRDGLGFDKDDADVHQLGSTSGDEYREMVCVRSKPRKLVVCSAHLTPGGGEYLSGRKREVATVQRILTSRYEGYTVLLGGDINDLPLSGVLDRLYHRDYGQGARGAFKEATSPCGDAMKPERRAAQLPRARYAPCRSGQPSHSKGKIDYVFVSPSVRVRSSGLSHSEHSDHKQLWARLDLPKTSRR
ncbi:endonuclease/exonuclease/phosphatase family protein [Streptomyces sp. WMMB 322]|uniref:endonuclease/exonuclease/phosphatase family protein n=1 Tax=Streptomyces sp. WMMB 322 TaxID=1286821 RepID=UPI000823A639|nr:endonuclease/exonuclease/phosphatase family protein [Streptomyces sp. WMMB 322]SCK16525.1 Metal-dependent hydrolase, endonuclease/exonuclease/phosphatase family [Streptomyces sp. WMMB 322]